ncbi:MAG: hypothetical protein FJ029_08705 [Actinobacteria bacterium]|nr:hypothetical protein [Actinomycetota bacterium]
MAGDVFDLLIRAGRVVSPDLGLDAPGAVAVRGDRIAASGPDVAGAARRTLDFPADLLLPGLVDLHAHPARGQSQYGVDPDVEFLARGVTTVASQGDAGALNWADYRATVVDVARTRVRMALNLSAIGEIGTRPCFASLEDVDVDACVRTIQAGDAHIWAIALNSAAGLTGTNDPREVVARGLAAAGRTNRPLLFGTRRHPDWTLADQLPWLRPGDVITYCFSSLEQNLAEHGRIRPEVWEARHRGVLFDIGHGMASFDFRIAEIAIGEGFLPDTISTDQYRRHVGSNPQHDLPRTLSKLLAAGMREADAWPRVTTRPAELLGLAGEIGTLRAGACADLAVLRWNPAARPLVDTSGGTRTGGCWEPVLTVRAGQVVAIDGRAPRATLG